MVLKNALSDEKSYKKILIYDISYKTFMGVKPTRIRFDEVTKIYNGTRYSELFNSWMYNRVYDKLNYLKELLNLLKDISNKF